MKAPSITKGNFSVVAGSRTAHCCFGFSVVDFEGESIAEVLSTESDAKLFAAAPMLAEALHAIVEDAKKGNAAIMNYKVEAAVAALKAAGYTEE